MIGYKLVRKMKDGSLSSLFINKKDRFSLDTWMEAREHKTKGYAFRKGWHCLLKPTAPHLSKENRVWVKIKMKNIKYFKRPEAQGGMWVLAQQIKITEELKLN